MDVFEPAIPNTTTDRNTTTDHDPEGEAVAGLHALAQDGQYMVGYNTAALHTSS